MTHSEDGSTPVSATDSVDAIESSEHATTSVESALSTNIPEAVALCVERIRKAEDEIRKAEDALAFQKATLHLVIGQSDFNQAELCEIYWGVPDVQAQPLCEKLGYSSPSHAALYGAWGEAIIGTCNTCGAEIGARSRAELDRWNGAWKTQCDDCSASIRYAGYEAEVLERKRKLQELRTMQYPAYLKTEHWQQVRQAALRRAKWKCSLCNSATGLDVHHRTYENRGAEFAADVIALCRSCHAKHHDKPA